MVERHFRPITPDERRVLDFLLIDAVPDAALLRAQAAVAQARRDCGCGCPSFSLAVDADRAPRAGAHGTELPVPVVESETVEDSPAHPSALLLFVGDGWLSGVELAPLGDPLPERFPPMDELNPPRLPHRAAGRPPP